MTKIKIIILDDNRIFRLGLKKILTDEEIEFVGEAADGVSGASMIRMKQPEVILLSNDLPEMNEVSFCEWVQRHFPKIKIIFLLKNREIAILNRLIKTSAKGFVTKDSRYLSCEIIKTIAKGKTYLQPDLALDLIQHPAHATDVLSQREYQILTLIAKNYTHEVIAEKLNISIKTVFNSKYRGFKKLGIHRAEELRKFF